MKRHHWRPATLAWTLAWALAALPLLTAGAVAQIERASRDVEGVDEAI